ncbi:BTB/POZ domain-containing protein [Sesamum angolense]|uniref:BTB/POZ domain-containing protein n=1 Tax=Sesamum angolense TaxID=2727404 RepID=A0AAE1WV91_9LAMI|nr:BTB/POZ domain-containing protein [Sesamum angolense]
MQRGTMSELCDLQFVSMANKLSSSLRESQCPLPEGKLRKIIKQEKRRTQIRNSGIEIDDFPGGPDGFELVSRFCYNNGSIPITVSNVSLLHCCAVFLGMSEKASRVNLLHQTEVFLEGIFYWSWNEILTCLKNCDPFFSCAESCGLVEKLLSSSSAKIAQQILIKSVLKEYSGLAGTAVNGVVSMGKTAFSCRGLFWVLRIVSGFGLSRERRTALERLIGGMLDQATLRRFIVLLYPEGATREIGPDPNLKISKFVGTLLRVCLILHRRFHLIKYTEPLTSIFRDNGLRV